MESLNNMIDDMVIEPLSDDLLDSIAGATSTGSTCCSCQDCSNKPKLPTVPSEGEAVA
ncbi:MAG TPA: hypothetical protein VK420_18555 [Longimicrobium sp.]|nr:hypothetical protein [Longimicrobium sp.]